MFSVSGFPGLLLVCYWRFIFRPVMYCYSLLCSGMSWYRVMSCHVMAPRVFCCHVMSCNVSS